MAEADAALEAESVPWSGMWNHLKTAPNPQQFFPLFGGDLNECAHGLCKSVLNMFVEFNMHFICLPMINLKV